MTYRFKPYQEALWFVGVAVVSVLAQELLTFDGNAVTDWRAWAVALVSALVRAAAGASLDWFRRMAMASEQSAEDAYTAAAIRLRARRLEEQHPNALASKPTQPLPPIPRYPSTSQLNDDEIVRRHEALG